MKQLVRGALALIHGEIASRPAIIDGSVNLYGLLVISKCLAGVGTRPWLDEISSRGPPHTSGRTRLMITTRQSFHYSLQSKRDHPLGLRRDVRKDAVGEPSMLHGLFRPIVGTGARWHR